jgi:hypothetical protein
VDGGLEAHVGGRDQVYRFIGPRDILAEQLARGAGCLITSADELTAFLDQHTRDLDEPFTFVVDLDGRLRLAPRRSEHVACAAGQPVLAAGELGFSRAGGGWLVREASNQSTGYCPEPASWTAVAEALRRAGLVPPTGFTTTLRFRRCAACGETNVIKDDWWVCAVCEAPLPAQWNFPA